MRKKRRKKMELIIPEEVTKREKAKKADFSDLFGSMPRKMSGQKFKDLAREGWK